MLPSIAFALAGRAGARLAAKLAVTVSRMTLLRLIRAHAVPAFQTPDVLGVDDFALRKGHVYASVILDMRTRRPIDVFAGRDAEPWAPGCANTLASRSSLVYGCANLDLLRLRTSTQTDRISRSATDSARVSGVAQ